MGFGNLGVGKAKSMASKNKKHRGPRHGHGNKSKGGGHGSYDGYNPNNLTISDAKKLYANQLAEGSSLQQAMQSNPAETMSYWDLIDDSQKTNTNQGSNMATFTGPAIAAGTSILKNLKNNNKLTVTGPQPSTGSTAPTKYNPGSFGDGGYRLTGNFPSTAPTINVSGNQSANTGSTNTNTASGPSGPGPSGGDVKDYLGGLYQGAFNRDPVFNADPSNTADYWVDAVSKGQQGDRDWKEWLAASIYGSDEKKNQNAGTGNVTITPNQTGPQQQQQQQKTGLTLDDLNSWWEGKQNNQPNQFDQFKEFMGMLGDMPGMGGGYGYGYPSMGYGGYAPGGVAAANPYGNMMSFMNAFKNMSSGGSNSTLASSSLTK